MFTSQYISFHYGAKHPGAILFQLVAHADLVEQLMLVGHLYLTCVLSTVLQVRRKSKFDNAVSRASKTQFSYTRTRSCVLGLSFSTVFVIV